MARSVFVTAEIRVRWSQVTVGQRVKVNICNIRTEGQGKSLQLDPRATSALETVGLKGKIGTCNSWTSGKVLLE
jgi:hypothetical protein